MRVEWEEEILLRPQHGQNIGGVSREQEKDR